MESATNVLKWASFVDSGADLFPRTLQEAGCKILPRKQPVCAYEYALLQRRNHRSNVGHSDTRVRLPSTELETSLFVFPFRFPLFRFHERPLRAMFLLSHPVRSRTFLDTRC